MICKENMMVVGNCFIGSILIWKDPNYIKKLRKAWGLCAKRYISLNRKLQKLDDVYFVRHVIYHEMSHLIHMNHSRAFYDVLKQFDPLLKKENEKLHKRVEALKRLLNGKN